MNKYYIGKSLNLGRELDKVEWELYRRVETDNVREGCLMVLEDARERGLEEVIILEGEVFLAKPILNLLDDFRMQNIDFDILILDGDTKSPTEKINEYLYKCTKVDRLNVYIVKRHYYDIMIEKIRNKEEYLSNNCYIFKNDRKNVIFFVSHFTERGSEIATYDYAHYNEEILGNKSYIVYFSDKLKKKINYATWVLNSLDTYEKFSKRFCLFELDDIMDIMGLIDNYNINYFYFLTHGGYIESYFQLDNKNIWGQCKTIKHCVFDMSGIESDFLLSISDFLVNKYSINVPVIPHIVKIPDYEGNLRMILGIPENSFVFGRYGGFTEFNIEYTKEAIIEFMNNNYNENAYFLFMNTARFIEHPRVIYLDRSVDMKYKVQFINTCDVMIHGRKMGETFGLAVAEFSSKNKPIITALSGDLEHCKILGEKGIFYKNKEELLDIFINIDKIIGSRNDWNAYRYYTPENIMLLFKNLLFS